MKLDFIHNAEPLRKRPAGARAFSLVEVTAALSVASFCMVSLLGLLPVCIHTTDTALQQTVASGIGAAVAADLQAAPKTATASNRYGLALPATGAAVGTEQTFYVAQDGAPTRVGASASSAVQFRVRVRITPPSSANTAANTRAQVSVSWPAVVDPNVAARQALLRGSWECVSTLSRNR
jgi:uncharacterized protein (TIGR02598 family)